MQLKAYLQILVTTLSLLLSSMSHAAKDQITVLLDWFINPDHAPLIVAEQTGFDKASLDVILVARRPIAATQVGRRKKSRCRYQLSALIDGGS